MARPRGKREQNKIANAFAAFEEAAKKHGIDLSAVKPMTKSETRDRLQARERDLDGVLMSLHNPHQMQAKNCKYCGEVFMTDYCYVAYCSQEHRVAHLRQYGIIWGSTGRNEPIWGRYEPPVVVSPEMVEQMEKWARAIIADLDRLRSQMQDQQPLPINDEPALTPEDLEELEVLSRQSPQEQKPLEQLPETSGDGPLATLLSQHDSLELLDFDF